MEAASLPGVRRRRTPSWQAGLALALYAGAFFVPWQLVNGTTPVPPKPQPATATPANDVPLGPTSTDLALGTIAARGARSVVSIGESAGFVAWPANGLSLVVTARPAGGGQTGPARSVSVELGSRELVGSVLCV